MSVFDIYFYLFSIIAVLCALALLVTRHPISGAVSLVGVMLSLAGVYSLLNAPFLGVIQILVYAGAIMMLVVFVIMVLNGAKDHAVPRYGNKSILLLLLIPIVFLVFLSKTINACSLGAMGGPEGTVEQLGLSLFDMTVSSQGYYILFEVIGLVLLSAIVGAVFLSKRDLSHPGEQGGESA